MTDEIVQYPNRYQMVPVAGTTDQFDFVRVRGAVTAEGDDLNKANLLPDSICSALGIPTTSLPKDALAALNTLASGRAKITTSSYTGTGINGSASPNSFAMNPSCKLMFIQSTVGDTGIFMIPNLTADYSRSTFAASGSSPYSLDLYIKLVGTTLSWYNQNSPEGQLNRNGTFYGVIQIG